MRYLFAILFCLPVLLNAQSTTNIFGNYNYKGYVGIGTTPQYKLDVRGDFFDSIMVGVNKSFQGNSYSIIGSPFYGNYWAYQDTSFSNIMSLGNTPAGNHTFYLQTVNGISISSTLGDVSLSTGNGNFYILSDAGKAIQLASQGSYNNNHVESNLDSVSWIVRHGHNDATVIPRWFMDNYQYGAGNTAITGGVFTGYGQGFADTNDSLIHGIYYKYTQDSGMSVYGKPTSGVLFQTKDSNQVQRFVAHDNGSLIINDGNQAQGRVLTSDDNGIASWQPRGWGLTGNAGTDPATNFLGTTDAVGFNIRSNNVQMLHFDEGSTNPNIVIGASTAPSEAENDIVIGNNVSMISYPSSNYAIAIGSGASIGSRQGIAIGAGSQTSGSGNVGNMAIGYRAVSIYDGSTAIGYNAYNTTSNQFAIGAAQSSIFAPGMASAVGSVLADDGTGIFTSQLPVSAGATGSEPSTPYLGQFFFDISLVKMKFWNGSVWAIIISTP